MIGGNDDFCIPLNETIGSVNHNCYDTPPRPEEAELVAMTPRPGGAEVVEDEGGILSECGSTPPGQRGLHSPPLAGL